MYCNMKTRIEVDRVSTGRGFVERASLRIALRCAVAMGALAAHPAWAETTEDGVSAASGDIIVNARRVEERLQDVPISITVFSQEQISDRNVVTATDLAAYTPSLSVNQRFGPEKSSFAIRGFVQEAGTAPSVAVYFADVVAPRANGGTTSGNNAPIGSFMDLQSVQVLKGPQGTLFGRNTTGGAVLLVPRKPTDRLEGSVEGTLGNFNLRRVQGVINVPLADTFKVRLALDRQKRDGYMRNVSGTGPDRYNDINYFAGRLGILAELTPGLENYTIATYSNSFGRGAAPRIAACDRSAAVNDPATLITTSRTLLATMACAQVDRALARGDSPYEFESSNPDPYLKLKQWQVINTTSWEASDNLTIKNIVSYAEFREKGSFLLFGDNFITPAGGRSVRLDPRLPITNLAAGTAFNFVFLQPRPNEDLAAQSTFTEELQLLGNAFEGRLTWQAGAYLEVSKTLGFNSGRSANLLNCSSPKDLVCTNPLSVGIIQDSATRFWFNNKGFYAQGSYDLTDSLTFTGGIRYTIDKTRADNRSVRLSLPSGRLTCNDTVRFGSGQVSTREQCLAAFSTKSEKPTWMLGLDYKPTDDILLYAKYSRGYRTGGINTTSIGLEGWGPEKVDTYEIGAKASFRGAVPGYFNLAVFHNDFSDQQLVVQGVSNVPGFSGSAPTVNAGKSRIQGAEIDSSVTLFDSLRLDLGYTYLKTKLRSITIPPFPNPPYSALLPLSPVGGPLGLSPKHRLSITGTYTLPLDSSIGDISLGATFVHTGKQFFSQNTLPEYQFLPASDLLNLNVNWDNFMGQPVDLSFFVTNVTKEVYHTAITGSYRGNGFEPLFMAPPRMWGVRMKYRFGE